MNASHEARVRVSVIMPVWNAERFLVEAVESVRAQTFSHWELLLVDDGSTDGSNDIARRYAHAEPERVRCLTHPGRENLGQSAARNLGIAHARGEYIALLDADDVWLPHKLEQQVPILDAHPHVGMVSGDTFWWYSWTGAPEDQKRDFIDSAGFSAGIVLPPPDLLALWLGETVPAPWPGSVLLRRSAVEAVGGFEDEARHLFEDQVFFSKICLAHSAYLSPQTWAKYRRHHNSFSAVRHRAGERDTSAILFLKWLKLYIAATGTQHPSLRRALRSRAWRHRHPRLARLNERIHRLPGKLRHRFRSAAARLLSGGTS